MDNPLTESQRDEMLSQVTEAHNVVANLLSDLRRRYAAKSPAVKVAAKAERDLFLFQREILKMDLENTPARSRSQL